MHSYGARTWRELLDILLHLPLPASAQKYLPPDFTLRNPVMKMVGMARRKGYHCALLYYCPEEKFSPGPLPPMPLQRQMRSLFSEVLQEHFPQEDILGVRRMGEEDVTVFVRSRTPFGQEHLKAVTESIRSELEKRIGAFAGSDWGARLQLIASCSTIDKYPQSTTEAVQAAYRFAHALATRRLPSNYAEYRQQLVHILNSESVTVLTQPIMSLRSGEILGWEVLTRGPYGTPFHFPSDLFEFSQQAGVLVPMEYLVIKKTLREIARQRIKEQVFINVTPVTLCHPHLLSQLLLWIEEFPGVNAGQIVLEITERHAINDFRHMAQVVEEYRKHGFRFAIDDAGAGYASLQTISELVPDIIKIDKSVIRDIDHGSVKLSILQALLQLAEKIRCEVIAEGVEREEEAHILCKNRVHMGQGYFFARPQPIWYDYGINHFAVLKETIIRLAQPSSA